MIDYQLLVFIISVLQLMITYGSFIIELLTFLLKKKK
jgi:hypothetical protein